VSERERRLERGERKRGRQGERRYVKVRERERERGFAAAGSSPGHMIR